MNVKTIFKWIIYALLFYLFTGMETALFSRLPIFGASPFIAPCFVALIAVYEDTPVFFALFAGIASDLLSSGFGLYTFMFTLIALLISRITEDTVRKNWLSALIFSVLAVAAVSLIRFFVQLILSQTVISALWLFVLPCILYSAIITAVLIPIIFAVSRAFKPGR